MRQHDLDFRDWSDEDLQAHKFYLVATVNDLQRQLRNSQHATSSERVGIRNQLNDCEIALEVVKTEINRR